METTLPAKKLEKDAGSIEKKYTLPGFVMSIDTFVYYVFSLTPLILGLYFKINIGFILLSVPFLCLFYLIILNPIEKVYFCFSKVREVSIEERTRLRIE